MGEICNIGLDLSLVKEPAVMISTSEDEGENGWQYPSPQVHTLRLLLFESREGETAHSAMIALPQRD